MKKIAIAAALIAAITTTANAEMNIFEPGSLLWQQRQEEIMENKIRRAQEQQRKAYQQAQPEKPCNMNAGTVTGSILMGLPIIGHAGKLMKDSYCND